MRKMKTMTVYNIIAIGFSMTAIFLDVILLFHTK